MAVIGASQSGLIVALGLQDQGHDVTLYNSRSHEQILNSKLRRVGYLTSESVNVERRLGLNFWEEQTCVSHSIITTHFDLTDRPTSTWRPVGAGPGQAVDQRTKIARWMVEFGLRGGRTVIQTLTKQEVGNIALANDLTIVASSGHLAESIFPAKNQAASITSASKNVSWFLVRHNELSYPDVTDQQLRFISIKGVGECYSYPCFTHTAGASRCYVFVAKPDGAMRFLDAAVDVATLLEKGDDFLNTYMPEDHLFLRNAKLTDSHAWYQHTLNETVLAPVGFLQAGQCIIGVGDAFCSNDQLPGQRSNNATLLAKTLLRSIHQNDNGIFDASWIQAAYTQFDHSISRAMITTL